MQRHRAGFTRGAVADEHECARHLRQEGPEVFRDHHRGDIRRDPGCPHHPLGGGDGNRDARRPIDRRRKLMRVLELAFRLMRAADAFADRTHPVLQQRLHVGVVAARIALDHDMRGDCVADAVGDEFGAGNDRRLARVHVARDDRLQGQHDLGADDQRVGAHVRPRRVCAAPSDPDDEVVLAGHDPADPRGDGTGRHAGHVVGAEQGVDREAIEETIRHHRLGAAPVLLGRLEHEADGAIEVAPLGQQPGGPEHHRHVAVVSARVHLAGDARRMGAAAGVFRDVQRVHVGADADRAASGPHGEIGHEPRPADAPMHVEAHPVERFGDIVGRLLLFEARLGMLVQMMAPLGHLRVQFGRVAHIGRGLR